MRYDSTMNLFSNNTTFNGVRVYALPRLDMINGVRRTYSRRRRLQHRSGDSWRYL